jgi:hypothetical protein
MFFCAITGKLSKPGEKCQKIVVESRERVYTRKVRNEETGRWEDVEVGRGWEIVKEVSATEEGVRAWNKMQADFAGV